MGKYKIIHGTFHVKGYAPDGDSIRFQADNDAHWDFFHWEKASARKAKRKQLRVEAIDSLETHYEELRQPPSFAVAALERILELVGITDVEYNLLVTLITSAKDGTPGYIAANAVDPFNRPVSFVFPESANLTDGAEFSDADLPLEKSINYFLLKEAIVYPTFYDTLETSIVERLREVAKTARANSRGLWAIDRTHGFRMWNPDTIQQEAIILPKLFRRFVQFFKTSSTMEGFVDYLKKHRDPILVDGQKHNLHDFLENKGNFYRLTIFPEDMIFAPKG